MRHLQLPQLWHHIATLIAHIRDFLTFPQLLALLELKTDFFPFKPDDDPEQALLFLAKQIGLL